MHTVNGTRHYYGSFGQRIIRSAMPQRIKLTREVSRKNGMPIRLSVSTTVFITNFIYRQMPFYQAVKLFIHASKLQSVALGNQKTTVPILFILLSKYAHTRLRISSDLSFSWSTGGKYPGVTFSLAPSIGTTYYGLPCKVS